MRGGGDLVRKILTAGAPRGYFLAMLYGLKCEGSAFSP
jgi:hypothetical protein